MRSRKKMSTTKYICRAWRSCPYAFKGKTPSGCPCWQGIPYPNEYYIGPGGKPGPYKYRNPEGSDKCDGIKITKKMELEIAIRML